MGQYVEKNLTKDEKIVKNANKTALCLVGIWFKGILLFWLLFIPTIQAIVKTIQFFCIDLALTNKRVIGKVGVFNTSALDLPLDKVQNVSTHQGFWGKIFKYGTIVISSASDTFTCNYIHKVDDFKNAIMAQVEVLQEDRMKKQAEEMAKAMASVINK